MNTLKSVMVVGALAVVGYGVYAMLNNNGASPPGAPPWPTAGATGDPNAPGGQPAPPNISMGSPASLPAAPGSPTPYGQPSPAAPGQPTPGGYKMDGGVPLAGPGAPAGVGGPMPAAPSAYGSPAPANPTGPYAAMPAPGAQPAVPMSRYEALTTGVQPASRFSAPAVAVPAGPAAAVPDAASAYARSMPATLQSPAPTEPSTAPPAADFDVTMAAAKAQLDRGQLDTALVSLSTIYDDPRLTERQQEQLNDLLDQVAGTVIYSRRFPVGAPHRVGAGGERLADIAQKYSVPPGLLAKINGLKESAELAPGVEIKVLKGPFDAQVNVPKRTLTLTVAGRYAGRFPVNVSDDEFKQIQGTYTVDTKKREHMRYDGQRFMELKPSGGGGAPPVSLAIVGMTDPTAAERGQAQGVIAVSPKNADDLYDILSQGSKVTIRR